MKYEVVPESCRVCLRKSRKQRSIFKPLEEGDQPPNVMLKLITGLNVDLIPGANELPKYICKNCELSLNLAFQFRSKALKSQKIIDAFCHHKRMYTRDPFAEPTDEGKVKQEEHQVLVELNTSEENALESSYEFKVEELEIPFGEEEKVEYLDGCFGDDFDATCSSEDEKPLSKVKPVVTPADSKDVLQLNIESAKEKIENNNEISIKDLCDETDIIKQSGVGTGEQNEKKFDYDVESEHCTITPKKYKSADAKSKVSTPDPLAKKSGRPKVNDESAHICDICGNIYQKRGRMMEHRRRHDTELRFACELCDKRFHLREKLRKHMFSHSGGKPYHCSFCSRTFFYESVKKSHEAVHKGIKPYVCEVCKKAFAYSHALKKHKLIHEDIKLYHCVYCDKDFRLQHHMKQHEETKLHQKAVQVCIF